MKTLIVAASVFISTGGTASACIQFGYDVQGYVEYLACLNDEQANAINELAYDLERLQDDLDDLDDETDDRAVILWNRDIDQNRLIEDQAETIRLLESALEELEYRVYLLEAEQ